MKSRSVLILDPKGGFGPLLADALGELYPAWTVAARDPGEAMLLLGSGGIDVVVPVVAHQSGGVALIEWLRRNYPDNVHVAADIGSPSQPGWSGHRADLGQRVGRTLVLRDRLRAPELAAFASELTRIPVISSVYQDICRLLSRSLSDGEDFSLQDVARLIGDDPGMAVKVLKMVNSAVIGLPRTVSSIEQAVALLGARRISTLVLGVSLVDQFHTAGPAGLAIERDWQSAMLTAQLSRNIATFEGLSTDEAETAYLAGLLHNIGRLVLAGNLTEQFVSIDWPTNTFERLALEDELLGARHTELGGLLAGFWGMDEVVCEAIAFYADPREAASRGFSSLAAVHAAAVLLGRGGLEWDEEFLMSAGLPDRIQKWSRLEAVQQLLAVAS